MTLGTGLCTLIGTKLRTKPYPKVQIMKFKVQKLTMNYHQSAKTALWKKSLYFALCKRIHLLPKKRLLLKLENLSEQSNQLP